MADAHHHRASSGLKQKNKSHKSSSKRATKRAAGAGRVERLGPGKKAGNAAGAKEKRLQRAKQLRQSKRDELAADRRGLHRGGDAPLNVAVVPLGAACDGAAAGVHPWGWGVNNRSAPAAMARRARRRRRPGPRGAPTAVRRRRRWRRRLSWRGRRWAPRLVAT